MLGRVIEALARVMAVLGGLVLLALVAMVCTSITGRWLDGVLNGDLLDGTALAEALLATGIGPIQGDFELVEAGMAFVIFAFLPWTQLSGGHASVDILTRVLPERVQRMLTLAWAALFVAVLILIARQLWLGLGDKMRYGETTYLIQFPIWWAYAAAFAGAAVATVTAIYVAVARAVEMATGAPILAGEEG